MTIVNSTVVGNADTSNAADGAGGIGATAGATVNLVNSIVSQNFASPGSVDDNVDPADLDTNVFNLLAGDPRLGPLQANGGPTFTLLPLPGSPVIDSGSNANATSDGTAAGTPLATDQRGVNRILDGNASGTATVDQGAVEFTINPAITFPGGPLTVAEGDSPAVLDAGATVTDADSPDFAGGTLTVEITSGATPEDRIGVRDEGTGAGQIGVSGGDVTFGGVTIGSFTGGTGSTPLVVTFNANATPAAVQALLRNLTFDTTALAPSAAPRTVQAALTDGDGGTSNPVLKTVTVTPAPVTVTIDQAAGQADPTNAQPVRFTVVFSEPVTGFDAADVSFAGSTAPGALVATVTGSGTTYTVEVTGATGSGTVVVGVLPGAAVDAAGNASVASTSTDNTVLFARVNQNEVGRFAVGPGCGGAGDRHGVQPGPVGGLHPGRLPRVHRRGAGGRRRLQRRRGGRPGGRHRPRRSPTLVRVIDGETQAELFSIQPFEASVHRRGVRRRRGPERGRQGRPGRHPGRGRRPAGPRLLAATGSARSPTSSGSRTRTSAAAPGRRSATSTATGSADLLVAAGFGGGPRIAVFDGRSLTGGGTPVKTAATSSCSRTRCATACSSPRATSTGTGSPR